jgi:hypothetical protein
MILLDSEYKYLGLQCEHHNYNNDILNGYTTRIRFIEVQSVNLRLLRIRNSCTPLGLGFEWTTSQDISSVVSFGSVLSSCHSATIR